MLRKVALVLVAVAAIASCNKPPTAMQVCNQLESAGIGSNCRNSTPGGLGAAAVEDAEFDLPSVPGHGGMVLRFDKDETYDRTVESYSKAAMLAGPHRYGSRKARIFVQMNDGASAEIGARAKAIVDALSGDAKLPSTPPPVAAPLPAAPSPSASPQVANAMGVCQRLAGARLALNCRAATGPIEESVFDLPAVPTKQGQVLHPDSAALYDQTAAAFVKKDLGYGSVKTRIFVVWNVDEPADARAKIKAMLDGL